MPGCRRGLGDSRWEILKPLMAQVGGANGRKPANNRRWIDAKHSGKSEAVIPSQDKPAPSLSTACPAPGRPIKLAGPRGPASAPAGTRLSERPEPPRSARRFRGAHWRPRALRRSTLVVPCSEVHIRCGQHVQAGLAALGGGQQGGGPSILVLGAEVGPAPISMP